MHGSYLIYIYLVFQVIVPAMAQHKTNLINQADFQPDLFPDGLLYEMKNKK